MDTERWSIRPHFRRAQRGPNPEVQDGYDLRDNVARSSTRHYTKREAKRRAEGQEVRESVIHWETAVSWKATANIGGRSELYVYDAKGERVGYVGLIGGINDEELAESARRLFAHLGVERIAEHRKDGSL